LDHGGGIEGGTTVEIKVRESFGGGQMGVFEGPLHPGLIALRGFVLTDGK
jgi:hypothetical protein